MAGAKRLRKLSAYQQQIARLGRYRVVHLLDEEYAQRVGFENLPNDGDAIVPSPVGPITSFNANGREIIRRDLPKERLSRYEWRTWTDWHGYSHSGLQSRTYEAYPREHVPPPNEHLIAMRRKSGPVFASRELNSETPHEEAVHILNMFLELFGEFEIVGANLESSMDIVVKRVNWKILPPGEYPFETAQQALKEYLDRLPDDVRHVSTDRIRTITRYRPNFMAIGLGGFSDYVVFGFSGKNRYVLESPNTGNATYVFRDDWQSVAQLTKAQILSNGLHEERLIHNQRWQSALRDVIGRD